MNAVTPVHSPALVPVSEHELLEAVARTPADQHLIWNGQSRTGRANSILTQALACIEEAWTPVSFRLLLRRAARLSGAYGLRPDAVKKSVWSHQSATPASYFLVRERAPFEYVAVTDVPRPSSWGSPIRAGELVMDQTRRLEQVVTPRVTARLRGRA